MICQASGLVALITSHLVAAVLILDFSSCRDVIAVVDLEGSRGTGEDLRSSIKVLEHDRLHRESSSDEKSCIDAGIVNCPVSLIGY